MSTSTKSVQAAAIPGSPQPLNETWLGRPQTISEFLTRYVLINGERHPGAPCHIAMHLVNALSREPDPYVHAHVHPDCDEIGLVVGAPGALEYEMILDGKVHRMTSPGSFFIPAGTVHRARALRGSGAYVCILMDPKGPIAGNSPKANP
jgi:mannose-6-phosphate isomerase-like protein (cupin superfamily)